MSRASIAFTVYEILGELRTGPYNPKRKKFSLSIKMEPALGVYNSKYIYFLDVTL